MKRNSFGCDKDECDCPKHLRLEGLDTPDGAYLPRIRHVVRLESMVTVGCKFAPDDLTPEQWRDLILLAHERHWIDDQVQAQRDRVKDEQELIDKGLRAAREVGGVPPPGQSLFKGR